MSTEPRVCGGICPPHGKRPRTECMRSPPKPHRPARTTALARDATARTDSGPLQYRIGVARPAWLAGPEAGSLTRQPKAGQVGGGPPLTRPARECQAGRLVRVTAIQARWVFQATRSVSGLCLPRRAYGPGSVYPPVCFPAKITGGRALLASRGAYGRRGSAASPAARIASSGAGFPVISSNCRAAWCSSSANPPATGAPDRPAATASRVGHGW